MQNASMEGWLLWDYSSKAGDACMRRADIATWLASQQLRMPRPLREHDHERHAGLHGHGDRAWPFAAG